VVTFTGQSPLTKLGYAPRWPETRAACPQEFGGLPQVEHPRQVRTRFAPHVQLANALDCYASWPQPTVIVSDGAYGVGGFPGDPPTTVDLASWYEPHVAAWSARALPCTTLWFWGTELGWATVHALLASHGWDYRACHVWDKGIAHIAGNANTKTLRKFPVVTEVCVQYVRAVRLPLGDEQVPIKDWLRREWARSGLPISQTNVACGVKNAASRKYFTKCRLWYPPPPAAFEALSRFANERGRPEGRPYFSLDGSSPLSSGEWAALRAKFRCEIGVTNVWREPAVRGEERLKQNARCLHRNQKPSRLIERVITASSDEGDVIWEPFGGLCTVALAAAKTGRRCFSAEISPATHALAMQRILGGGTIERPKRWSSSRAA